MQRLARSEFAGEQPSLIMSHHRATHEIGVKMSKHCRDLLLPAPVYRSLPLRCLKIKSFFPSTMYATEEEFQ